MLGPMRPSISISSHGLTILVYTKEPQDQSKPSILVPEVDIELSWVYDSRRHGDDKVNRFRLNVVQEVLPNLSPWAACLQVVLSLG